MRFAIVKILANQMSETTPTQHFYNFNMAAVCEESFFPGLVVLLKHSLMLMIKKNTSSTKQQLQDISLGNTCYHLSFCLQKVFIFITFCGLDISS